MQVNMLEAKNQLSKLVKAAMEGEDVVIANHGKPMVRLVKMTEQPKTRGVGAWKGLVEMSDDWDSPETNAEIARRILDSPLFPEEKPAVAPKLKTRRSRLNACCSTPTSSSGGWRATGAWGLPQGVC